MDFDNKQKIIIITLTDDEWIKRNELLEEAGLDDEFWDYPVEELDYLMERLLDNGHEQVVYGLYEGRLYEMP